ncbi:MAG: ABC transporter substrate-binding protein [Rhodobacteraceae bacterium]|nr:ABC transporter substrate-binding protein [Paracoccaceae bacterium]
MPPSLGVPFTAAGQPSSEIWIAIFDTLTRIDPNGAVQPALALSWENVSPTVWRFELRPNVTFHNGAPFNADTVIATFEILKGPEGRKYYVASEGENIERIAKIDDLTIEFVTRKPDPLLPRRLNIIYMVEPGAWNERGPDGFAQAPVGTGPFAVTDWGQASGTARFSAHHGGWRAPKVDAIEVYTVLEPVRRVQALLSGQVDIATRLGPDELLQLPPDGLTVVSLQKPQVMSLTFRTENNANRAIVDPRVRRAMSLAVDRQSIVDSVFGGRASAASQGVSPVTIGYAADLEPLTYDPAAAKQMLADAGYPNGFPLKINVFIGQVASDELIYQQVAQNLREVGIDVELRTFSYAQWLQAYLSGQWGDIDAFSFVWDAGSTYDASRPLELTSCAKVNAFFCDRSLMPLIEATQTDMSPDTRIESLKAWGRATREQMPAIWIINLTDAYAAQPRVAGLEVWAVGLQYEKLSINPKSP